MAQFLNCITESLKSIVSFCPEYQNPCPEYDKLVHENPTSMTLAQRIPEALIRTELTEGKLIMTLFLKGRF